MSSSLAKCTDAVLVVSCGQMSLAMWFVFKRTVADNQGRIFVFDALRHVAGQCTQTANGCERTRPTVDGRIPAPLDTHGNPLCIGIYRGIIIPRFLRWCEMDFVHPQYTRFLVTLFERKTTLAFAHVGRPVRKSLSSVFGHVSHLVPKTSSGQIRWVCLVFGAQI